MRGRSFIDTNVFVYSFDAGSRDKMRCARGIISSCLRDHSGFTSTQVVQEFLNVATRKFSVPMSASQARSYMAAVLVPLCEVFPTMALLAEALSIQAETGFGYYDSLVVAAASHAGAKRLLTEDMQHGRTVRGVTITNPFA